MPSGGVRRKVDDLGRVVIPASMRKTLGIADGDLVEFRLEADEVVIRKPAVACVFCGSDQHLRLVFDKPVCWSCLSALRATGASSPSAEQAG